jgi:hypothetical protein
MVSFHTDVCDYSMPIDDAVKVYNNGITTCDFKHIGEGVINVRYYLDVGYYGRSESFYYWGQSVNQLRKLITKRECDIISEIVGNDFCPSCIKLIQKGSLTLGYCPH